VAAANPSGSECIQPERADSPEVVALLAALDAYLGTLYEPEANHILSVSELLSPQVQFLVARVSGQAVGCGAFRRMPGEADTGNLPYVEIKRMMVSPSMRGGGLATRLLNSLEAKAQVEGFNLALLETGGEQREAVRLYERCGYVRRGAFGGYPDNGLSWFYEKQLCAA
jgi:putative acetyltransferase